MLFHAQRSRGYSFKRLMKFSCFNFLKGSLENFFFKEKQKIYILYIHVCVYMYIHIYIFNINILNSFFNTVLKYPATGKLHPIAAPVRLEAEGPLCLEASLTRSNKTLKKDDHSIGKVLSKGSTQISGPFTCLAQGKVMPASCR